MLRALRLLTLLGATLAAGVFASPDVVAQEKPNGGQEHRLDVIRRMDKDQKARLRRALEEFQRMPPAKQQELRRKAKKVGDERLLGLAGKDVDKLRRRHEAMQRRRETLLRMIGPERLEGLTEDEKAYVEGLAGRRLFEYCSKLMLKHQAPIDREEWRNLTESERRERMKAAGERFEAQVLARRSEEERAEYAQADRKGRRKLMRGYMEADYEKIAMDFAPVFEQAHLKPFLALPPEKRAERVEHSKKMRRWWKTWGLLKKELSKEHRRRLWRLRPDQLKKVRELWEAGKDLTEAERRTSVQELIDKLYSESTPDSKEGRFRPPTHWSGGGGGDRDGRRKRRGPRRR